MTSKVKTSWDDILKFKDRKEQMEHHADMLSLKIALDIKRYLEDNEISYKDLAAQMGTSAAYITQVLRGDKRINMLFLARLMSALGIEISLNITADKKSARTELDKALNVIFTEAGRVIYDKWASTHPLQAAGGFKK